MADAATLAFPLVSVLGSVRLAPDALRQAALCARESYEAAEAQEFCGDAIDAMVPAPWVPALDTWFLHEALRDLGLECDPEQKIEMLATATVDKHEDHIHGFVLILVLFKGGPSRAFLA